MKYRILRTLAVLVICSLLLSLVPFPAAHAVDTPETNPYWDTVEQQVCAYAKSINITDADTEAAWALAGHGITGRGSKLNAGADHPLTATLMNSELGLATVIRGCAIAVDIMAQNGMATAYNYGGCYWGGTQITYSTTIYPSATSAATEWIFKTGHTDYSGKLNGYDDSLTWIAGSAKVLQYFTRVSASADSVTYLVKVVFEDRFDFSTGTGSVPKEILSLIGSFLFREFDWTATAEFEITVPNTCIHAATDCQEVSTTPPTCASQGYSHFICTWCGYEFDGAYTDPLPHSWGPWTTTRKPTHLEEGEESRSCAGCGHTERRSINKLEYTPGDANGDTEINTKDLILLRQSLAGWDVNLTEAAADTNGDGTVNTKDLILLRQYLAGWNVSLGQ